MYKEAKKIFLAGSIILLSYFSGSAQVISKESIPKALEYLAQVANVHFLDILSKKYNGQNKRNVDAVKQVLGIPDLTLLISKDSLKSLMKNNDLTESYEKVAGVIYKLEYKKDLDVNDLIRDIDSKLKNVNGLELKNFSGSIISELAPLITNESESNLVVDPKEDIQKDGPVKDRETKRGGVIGSTLSFLIIWVVRGLALVGSAFLALLFLGFKLIRKSTRPTKNNTGEYDSHKIPPPNGDLELPSEKEWQKSENEYVQENKLSKTKIDKLEKDIEAAKMKIEQLQTVTPPIIESKEVPIEPHKMEEIVPKTLYFASPNGDGSFPVSKQDYILDDSFHSYQLTKKSDNANQATIDFTSNALFSNILSTPHQYIDPVFIQENVPTAATKKIRVIKPGLWELKDEKWERQTKATIIYEQ